MSFIIKEKTNWKYVLIILFLALGVGVFVLRREPVLENDLSGLETSFKERIDEKTIKTETTKWKEYVFEEITQDFQSPDFMDRRLIGIRDDGQRDVITSSVKKIIEWEKTIEEKGFYPSKVSSPSYSNKIFFTKNLAGTGHSTGLFILDVNTLEFQELTKTGSIYEDYYNYLSIISPDGLKAASLGGEKLYLLNFLKDELEILAETKPEEIFFPGKEIPNFIWKNNDVIQFPVFSAKRIYDSPVELREISIKTREEEIFKKEMPVEEEVEDDKIDKERLKEILHATEIVSYDLKILVDLDEFRRGSIEFWTEATCPFEGRDYEYKIPEGFAFNSCKEGEVGSHGGCPTCEMSKVSLDVCNYDEHYCSLEGYIESIKEDHWISMEDIIEGKIVGSEGSDVFYLDTKFDPEFKLHYNPWRPYEKEVRENIRETIAVLDIFLDKIDIPQLSKGEYSKNEVERMFKTELDKLGSIKAVDIKNFKKNAGKLDPEYGGDTAIITFTNSMPGIHGWVHPHYILIVNRDGERRLLMEAIGHKLNWGLENEVVEIGDKFFFETSRYGEGGMCAGAGTTKSLCRLKEGDFFCYYGIGRRLDGRGGPQGCGPGGNIQIEYDTRDVDNNGENEVVISFIAEYHRRSQTIKEKTYKLDEKDELILINSETFGF